MKILIVGVGRVGSQVAMMSAMLLKPKKIILNDIKALSGDILDLRHAFLGLGIGTEITERIEPSDYIVITAGIPNNWEKPIPKDTLFSSNIKTVRDVISMLQGHGAFKRSTRLIIMTNPVEEITEAITLGMPQYHTYNPEKQLLRIRKGKELGMTIVKTKGYTNFGAAVSCVKLIQTLEKQGR